MADGPTTIDMSGKVILTGISSHAFEHPADRTALTAMRSVPGFDQVVKVSSGMLRERQYRLAYLASGVRVGERQFPAMHAMLTDAMAVLDVARRPELYVYSDPAYNAVTLGVDKPFIAVSSALYDVLEPDELAFVVGHELGHVLAGHALYQSLLIHLLNLAGTFSWVPIGGLGLRAITAALREWSRKSELSADRAGLLVVQDPDVAIRVHMKLAGGAHLDQIEPEAFLAQAAEYESAGDLRDGVLKLLNTEKSTHPFAVVRAAEIRRWVDEGGYDAILAGDYARRGDEQTATFGETAREAARSYRRRMETSTDPLVGAVRTAGSTLGSVADGIGGWILKQTKRPSTDVGQPGDEPGPIDPPPAD